MFHTLCSHVENFLHPKLRQSHHNPWHVCMDTVGCMFQVRVISHLTAAHETSR